MCEICKKYTDKFYLFDKDKIPYASRKVCKTCYHTACRQCHEQSYALNDDKICSECAVDNEWMMDGDWEGRFPNETYCGQCGKERHLNAEGLCKDCYRELHGQHLFFCLDCSIEFRPGSPSEVLCDTCKPHCLGCGAAYNPERRTDTLCSSCAFKAARGTGDCSRCGDHNNELDHHAHCPKCSDELYDMIDTSMDKTIWCRRCSRNKVMPHSPICKSCLNKEYVCPTCLKVDISPEEYMCVTCKKENHDKWENSIQERRHNTMR